MIETESTSMENITILQSCCTKLLNRRISSVPTEQLQSGEKKLLETESGEASQCGPANARRTHMEFRIKEEQIKSLVNFPRLPQASGNRMIQNVPMSLMSEFEALPTTEESTIHSTKIFYITTLHEDDGWRRRTSMCKEHTGPRNLKDSGPFASIDANEENWSSLECWNCCNS